MIQSSIRHTIIYANFIVQGKLYTINPQVYDDPDNDYDRHDYAVARFLDLFSTKNEDVNPNDYCLAYMFTHRDFEDGVLGR